MFLSSLHQPDLLYFTLSQFSRSKSQVGINFPSMIGINDLAKLTCNFCSSGLDHHAQKCVFIHVGKNQLSYVQLGFLPQCHDNLDFFKNIVRK